MRQHAPPALLTPALAGVLLIAFLLSGLMTGVLTRGLVESLRPLPTATPVVAPTATLARPTATSTLVALIPSGAFDLGLAASPTHVQPGGDVMLTVTATSGGAPVGSLRCTLGASRQGGTPLLATWPPAKVTNESGHATWSITAPTQPGTYAVQVSANGANHYSAWGFATVYVG